MAGVSSFGRHYRQKMTPELCRCSQNCASQRFPSNGSLHPCDFCRRLSLLVDLCLLCLVLWAFRSRGGVGRAGAAEKASGESLRLTP